MALELFSLTIHDPDVVFTDLGLAILGVYLGRRLWLAPGRGTLQQAGTVLMGGLASAAFWGAIFHAFFPAGTATLPGFIAYCNRLPRDLRRLRRRLRRLKAFPVELAQQPVYR